MFSVEQKRQISEAVQQVLRATGHPELPEGEIRFTLHVDGAESWSWADIQNNGAVAAPSVNPHNERAAFPAEREKTYVIAMNYGDFKEWCRANRKVEGMDAVYVRTRTSMQGVEIARHQLVVTAMARHSSDYEGVLEHARERVRR